MTKPRNGAAPITPADPTEGFSRLARLLGQIVAPITLVTALMVYFGWARAGGTYDVFGIDRSVLGFTVQDYLLQSLNPTFKPLAALLLGLLVLVPGHKVLVRLLQEDDEHKDDKPLVLQRQRRRRAAVVLCWIIGGLGLVLALVGVIGLLELVVYPGWWPVTPTSLGLGVLLIGYAWTLAEATGLRAAPERADPPGVLDVLPRVALAAVVVLTSFWSVATLAQKSGLQNARSVIVEPKSLPRVSVFAGQRLHLDDPGVRETELPGAEARYRFRYDGLRLLVRSNNRYFLLPVQWRPGTHAIVLPDDPALRIELFRAGT